MTNSKSNPTLEEYRVLLKNGFLPDSLPLQRLQNPYYEPWESLVHDLPSRIKARTLRPAVDSLPILTLSGLTNEPEWRRAYVVLAYLTHGYIWGGEKPRDVSFLFSFRCILPILTPHTQVLPPCIACPFLEVSARLDLPACATYAAVCLWNFTPKKGETDLTSPENLSVNTSFTGTQDEEWFFVVSVAIEAKGAAVIPLMLDAIHAVRHNNPEGVTTSLDQISETIRSLAKILQRMYEKCSPAVFFHVIRPFLAGGKNMAAAGLPNGVFYDLGDNGQGKWYQYSGGSNAQSSLIQAFDVFLDVHHTATGGKDTTTNPVTDQQATKAGGYLQVSTNQAHHQTKKLKTKESSRKCEATCPAPTVTSYTTSPKLPTSAHTPCTTAPDPPSEPPTTT